MIQQGWGEHLHLEALDHKRHLALRNESKPLLMQGPETSFQIRHRGQLQRAALCCCRKREQQSLLGIGIAQFQRNTPFQATGLPIPIGPQLLFSQGQCALQLRGQRLELCRCERAAHGPLPPLALAGLPHAIGRKNPRQGMQQDLPQAQGMGNTTRQLSGRSPIGHQHTTANVMAPRQRHLPNGRCHGFYGQREGPFR